MTPVVNNLSVFPFYGPIFDWDHVPSDWNSRKYWAFGQAYPFIVPKGTIPTAQIPWPYNAIDSLMAYPVSVVGQSDWVGYGIAISSYSIVPDVGGIDGNDMLVINDPEGNAFASAQPGAYFMVASIGDEYYYSDIFISSSEPVILQEREEFIPPENILELSWWDEEDFVTDGGSIAYEAPSGFLLPNFPNRIFLPADIGMPNYLFEEEGENRDGYFFAQKQISKKVYRFNFLAPEYLCDSLRLVRMADHIRVRYGGHTYWATNFTPSFEWQEGGALAAVTAEFETNTVAKKIGYGRMLT